VARRWALLVAAPAPEVDVKGEEVDTSPAAAWRRLVGEEERREEGARCEGNVSELDLDLHIARGDGGPPLGCAACWLLKCATPHEHDRPRAAWFYPASAGVVAKRHGRRNLMPVGTTADTCTFFDGRLSGYQGNQEPASQTKYEMSMSQVHLPISPASSHWV
jgi:hypothetical protein